MHDDFPKKITFRYCVHFFKSKSIEIKIQPNIIGVVKRSLKSIVYLLLLLKNLNEGQKARVRNSVSKQTQKWAAWVTDGNKSAEPKLIWRRWIKGLETIEKWRIFMRNAAIFMWAFQVFKFQPAKRYQYWLSYISSNHLRSLFSFFLSSTFCSSHVERFFSRPNHFRLFYLLFIFRTYSSTLCLPISGEQTNGKNERKQQQYRFWWDDINIYTVRLVRFSFLYFFVVVAIPFSGYRRRVPYHCYYLASN